MLKCEKPSIAGQADADGEITMTISSVPFRPSSRQRKSGRSGSKELEKSGGSRADRRLAALLANCRKGSRCHLFECAVCERRKLIAWRGVPASVVKSVGSLFERNSRISEQ